MQDIIIDTPTQKSVIRCGKGSFGRFAEGLDYKKLFVITDSNVFAIYRDLIKETFKDAPVYVIRAGEASKTYSTLIAILKHMLNYGATRAYTVVALGGGVVGDIAGLVASLFMRGVKLIQIPTTLLSQVDSSVGGKTAVDLNNVKNAIGTFYQPGEVIVDPMFLATLPKREIRCGLGEIIKYGALDAQIYKTLSENCDNLFDEEFLESITAPCIQHKANVVAGDEKDLNGLRKTLNLGHTTGHAFELYYKRKSHGEFVLIGTYYELLIAEQKGVCGGEYAKNLKKLIGRVIKNIPAYDDAQKAALAAKFDKKNDEQSTVSMIVPATEGRCEEIKMPLDEYVKTIGEIAVKLKEKK
ncbi:MAG: 3-dehydroquinate synthase family protein [Candidatus Coproplasma sp.]